MSHWQAEPDWDDVFSALRDAEEDGEPGVLADGKTLPLAASPEVAAEVVTVRLIDPEEQLIRWGRQLLQRPHRRHGQPDGDPTETEICAMCRAIQTEWSHLERRKRAPHALSAPVEVNPTRSARQLE